MVLGWSLPGPGLERLYPIMTLSKLVKELGYEAHVHGFKTSFKTWAQEKTDFADKASEMTLAHTISNKAKATYARSNFLEKRAESMESWAGYFGWIRKTADPIQGHRTKGEDIKSELKINQYIKKFII